MQTFVCLIWKLPPCSIEVFLARGKRTWAFQPYCLIGWTFTHNNHNNRYIALRGNLAPRAGIQITSWSIGQKMFIFFTSHAKIKDLKYISRHQSLRIKRQQNILGIIHPCLEQTSSLVDEINNLKSSTLSTVLDDNLLGGFPRRRSQRLHSPHLGLDFKGER